MKPKVYIETTIPSYLVGLPSRDLIVAAHQELTREWWQFRQDDFDIFISQFIIDEASLGDPDLSGMRIKIIQSLTQLEITKDVEVLATELVLSNVIPKKAATDAAHIAIASVHSMDYMLTWNCTHIANAEIYKEVQIVCDNNGFSCPIICTQEELMGENDNEI